jgi:hypothetical protein
MPLTRTVFTTGALLLALAAPAAAQQTQDPLSDYGVRDPEGGQQGVQRTAASRLSGPTGCVDRTVFLTIRGRGIRRVEWSVNGRRVRTTTTKDGRTRLRLVMGPRGVYRVAARVVYRASTGARAVTRRTVVQRCAQAQLPQFTG